MDTLEKYYRFGFNGQEKDDEIYNVTGSSLNFKFRMYDSRIGRFNKPDPLTKKYPELSPYQFASLNPIWKREIEGLEGSTATGSEDIKNKQGETTGTTSAIDATAIPNTPSPSTTLSPGGNSAPQQSPGFSVSNLLNNIDNSLQGNTYYYRKSGIAAYSKEFGTQNNENNYRADPNANDVTYVDFTQIMLIKPPGSYSYGNNPGEGIIKFTKGAIKETKAVVEINNSNQPKMQITTSENVEIFRIYHSFSMYYYTFVKDTPVTKSDADSINKKSLVKNKIFRKAPDDER